MIAYRLLPRGSAEVHVRVVNGVAHLHGQLPDAAPEDAVVRAASTVPGAVDVRADFAVRPVSA